MISKSDKKLSQQVKVLLERLPESVAPPISNDVKTIKLHKSPNYETSKKSNKEDINIKESNMPSSVKKEKKVFEAVDCKIERFSKEEHIYSSYVKNEKIILDAYKNPSSNIDLNRKVTSKPKDWFSKETKIEKETKESLKGIIESNISNKINLRKRPYPSKNDSERKIRIQNKVEPLIELVPLVVKTEEPEIITVKKIQHKAHNIVEIDKEIAKNSLTVTPSSQELVSQNAFASIVIPYKILNICKSIPHSSKAVESKGVVESSHQTLRGPDNDLAEEDLSNRGIAEFSHQPLGKLDDGLVRDYLDGCTVESSCQSFERTEVNVSERAPTNKVVESNSKTLGMPGEGFEDKTSTKDNSVEYIHHISKGQSEGSETLPQDQSLGRLDNGLIDEGHSIESNAEFSHQTLEKPEEGPVKEYSLNRCTVESTHKTLERTEVGLLNEAPTNKGTFESISKTLEMPEKGFEVEDSTNDSVVNFIHQVSKRQDEGFEALPQDQTLGRLNNGLVEKSTSSKIIAEFSHHTLEEPEDGLVIEESLDGCSMESIHKTLGRSEVGLLDDQKNHSSFESISKTLARPRKGIEDEACTNDSAVEYIHQTLESQGEGSVTLQPDHTLDNDFVEEDSSNGGIAEFNHHILEKSESSDDGRVKDFLNRCTVESKHKTLGRTEVVLLEEVPINRKESNHNTLERLGEGFENEASKNGNVVGYIHQTSKRLRDDFEDESSTNGSTAESNDHRFEMPGVSPVEISQTLDVQHKPMTTFLNSASTITRKGFTSDKIIKVKAPQALGIQSLDIPGNPQNTCLENRLNISHLSQIRSTSGNESRIAEICKVYPIFFTSEARTDISILIKILHKVSRGLTWEQIKSKQCDETYLLNIQNCSKMFVKTFNRILKLDQIGLDKDLLKKIIPILYLHLDKGFKRLRPLEDFDFRIIMKKMFEAESFVCDHDVILEKNYEMFRKVMITFDRWLEDIFIECDVTGSLEPFALVDNVEDDSQSLSGRLSPDSLEEPAMELRNDNLATSEQQIDSIESTRTQDVDSLVDADVELNYLQCPICRESLPMCCICKELLSCPCLSELHQTLAFDRGPRSLFFCREHAACGDIWPQWLEDWIEEREDHNMPLDPICWNVSCNNKAELLCVCRIQAYCSLACQVVDWHEEHHKSCRRESDPKCYFVPGEEDMDVS